jgi:hypothetical protein
MGLRARPGLFAAHANLSNVQIAKGFERYGLVATVIA